MMIINFLGDDRQCVGAAVQVFLTGKQFFKMQEVD
jgi:hypothetical protein